MEMLFTIGHSTHSLQIFIQLLAQQGVHKLADVRRYPGSRRLPHFHSSALAEGLASVGITYRHFEALGGRRPAKPDSPNTAWRNSSFKGYADYMLTAEFITAAQELLSWAGSEATAYMCAEGLWWQCHRALISDHLQVQGYAIHHILPTGKLAPHPYTTAATIVQGKLSYAKQDLFTPAEQDSPTEI